MALHSAFDIYFRNSIRIHVVADSIRNVNKATNCVSLSS